jgi:hypothetical protein
MWSKLLTCQRRWRISPTLVILFVIHIMSLATAWVSVTDRSFEQEPSMSLYPKWSRHRFVGCLARNVAGQRVGKYTERYTWHILTRRATHGIYWDVLMTYREVLMTYTGRYSWHILTGTHEILTSDYGIYLEVLMKCTNRYSWRIMKKTHDMCWWEVLILEILMAYTEIYSWHAKTCSWHTDK